MKKLEKVKTFMKDHKEDIMYTTLVGACCFVWYRVGRIDSEKLGIRRCKETLNKALNGQIGDLQYLIDGHRYGANMGYAAVKSDNKMIPLSKLSEEIVAHSEFGFTNDTPIRAFVVLGDQK